MSHTVMAALPRQMAVMLLDAGTTSCVIPVQCKTAGSDISLTRMLCQVQACQKEAREALLHLTHLCGLILRT